MGGGEGLLAAAAGPAAAFSATAPDATTVAAIIADLLAELTSRAEVPNTILHYCDRMAEAKVIRALARRATESVLQTLTVRHVPHKPFNPG